MTRTAVILGDSITRGQVSASFIVQLRRKVKPSEYQFINHGVNNDTTFNLLRRVHHAGFLNPDFIFIFIGTNDMIAARSEASAAFYRLNKRIPQRPTVEWSGANVKKIVRYLKNRTRSKIALLSIPMLGEDLSTSENENVRAYNHNLSKTAVEEKVAFLPIYDRLAAVLQGFIGQPFRTSGPMTAEFLARRLLYSEDFNTFSQRKGYRLFIDGVHLNRRGAEIVANEILAFLNSSAPPQELA